VNNMTIEELGALDDLVVGPTSKDEQERACVIMSAAIKARKAEKELAAAQKKAIEAAAYFARLVALDEAATQADNKRKTQKIA